MPFLRIHVDLLHTLEKTKADALGNILALFPIYSLMRVFHPFILMRLKDRHPENHAVLYPLLRRHREQWPALEPSMTQVQFCRMRDWLMSLDFAKHSLSEICLSAPSKILESSSDKKWVPLHKPSVQDGKAFARWELEFKATNPPAVVEETKSPGADDSASLALALSLAEEDESNSKTRVIPVSGRVMDILRDNREPGEQAQAQGPRRCVMCGWTLQYRGRHEGHYMYSCQNFKGCDEASKLVG